MLLAVQRWGLKDSGKRLLFLHGMAGTGKIWRPVAIELENKFDILAPDQRGHGNSQLDGKNANDSCISYTPIAYAQDVHETQEEIGFSPAAIIGHSMGVRTACALAHLFPKTVLALVLVDLGLSGPFGGGFGENLYQLLLHMPLQMPSRQEARLYFQRHSPDPAITQYLMAVSQPQDPANPSGVLFFPFDRRALLLTLESVRSTSAEHWIEDAAEQGIPILFLRGEQSRVWSEDQFKKDQAHFNHYPSLSFEQISGAGHGLPFEKRREFVDRMLGFFARTDTFSS